MATRTVLVARFERVADPLLHFQEITLDGRKVTTVVGSRNLRAADQSATVSDTSASRFPTEVAARADFEASERQQQARWPTYTREKRTVETADTPPRVADASHPELEARFTDGGGLDEARVLADWQLTQQDVRGEFAALRHAGRTADAEALLQQYAELLFGELDVLVGEELRDFVWRHGYLVGATLHGRSWRELALAELTRDFLITPIARFVTELRFGLAGFSHANDWAPTMEAIALSPRGHLVSALRFDDYTYEDSELSWTPFGDFSPYWSMLPGLQLLHIRSGEGGTLGRIELPELRTFIRESGGLGTHEIESIVEADWPKLEQLDVWFGRDQYGATGTADSLARVLDGRSAPNLTRLGVINCEFTPAFLPLLLASPLLPRLTSLDFSKGVLTDDDARWLAAHADAFRHLELLDVRENALSAAGADALRAVLPKAAVHPQRTPNHRYAAVGE